MRLMRPYHELPTIMRLGVRLGCWQLIYRIERHLVTRDVLKQRQAP